MKELSIEQKARAYDETLERAKQLLATSVVFDRFTIERIFPELKENEDERVRKALINYLITDEDNGVSKVGQIPIDNVIAWLEKQGEQESIDPDTLIQQRVDTLADIDAKQSSADNVKPKVKNEIEIPFGAKDSELQEATYYIPKGFYAEIDDNKIVIKKGKNPTKLSDEDEHRVKDTIYFLDTAKKHYASTVELDTCIDWLKSIKQRIGG